MLNAMRELAFVELCLPSALHAEGGPELVCCWCVRWRACVCVDSSAIMRGGRAKSPWNKSVSLFITASTS